MGYSSMGIVENTLMDNAINAVKKEASECHAVYTQEQIESLARDKVEKVADKIWDYFMVKGKAR